MAAKIKVTTDAIEILHQRYYSGKSERLARLEAERLNAKVALQIHELRTAAGLSQRQLALLVKTTASVICRLEDADYEGHSLTMLQRIATALDQRIELRFVPNRAAGGSRRSKPRAAGRRRTAA
jgi:ribosome-binding protein aMBF1 (putative translation factor)